MASQKSYNTKQKEMIRSIIEEQLNEFTVKDIHEGLKETVGLTTIYRVIDKMVEEGHLKKTISSDNITYYQYLKECNHDNHFYLKCERCGCLIHVDCDCIEDLSTHILKNHNFITSKKNIIIDGICASCLNNRKEV